MNTRLSGSARVDDIKGHPQGELRGLAKLVNITEDVRKYAAQRGISEAKAVTLGMSDKAAEFARDGTNIYRAV